MSNKIICSDIHEPCLDYYVVSKMSERRRKLIERLGLGKPVIIGVDFGKDFAQSIITYGDVIDLYHQSNYEK